MGQVSCRVEPDPFAQVKDLITDSIDRWHSQASSETNHMLCRDDELRRKLVATDSSKLEAAALASERLHSWTNTCFLDGVDVLDSWHIDEVKPDWMNSGITHADKAVTCSRASSAWQVAVAQQLASSSARRSRRARREERREGEQTKEYISRKRKSRQKWLRISGQQQELHHDQCGQQ